MFYLAAVNIIALRLPNVDAATNNGIHHAITPSILSANVYAQMHKTLIHATWLQSNTLQAPNGGLIATIESHAAILCNSHRRKVPTV